MTEFTTGIWTVLRRLVAHSSISRALIYTMGHIIIAMTVVSVMTGASLWEAGAVALIEPAINGCWFYLLDKMYVSYNKTSKSY